jgi:DNA-binding CsgD family transcriptional regulator
MITSRSLYERAFKEIKRLCNSGLDESTLLPAVVERLQDAVAAEAYCCFAMDPVSGLMMRAVSEGLGGEKRRHFFLEHIYLEEDVNGYDWRARNWRQPVMLLSEATGGRLERSLRYREFLQPSGLGHEMRGVCTLDKERWGGTDLTREKGRPDFNPQEVAFLRRVAPHLGAGLRAAALRAQASSDSEGEGLPGVLVLDHRGWVIQYTQAAKGLLEELEDLGPGWQEGAGLPLAIWMVASAVRKALKAKTDRDQAMVPRLCIKARSGRWLTLQGALTEAKPGQPGGTMIFMEPAGPKEMTWLRTSAYGLTPREREVVDLVLRGASGKQISETLYISEYTVQEHLSNIFDKVGVRGRRALVKRLFFDNLYPPVRQPVL